MRNERIYYRKMHSKTLKKLFQEKETCFKDRRKLHINKNSRKGDISGYICKNINFIKQK